MTPYETQLRAWSKRRDRIWAMLEKGMTQAEIGRKLNVKRQAINKILRKANGK